MDSIIASTLHCFHLDVRGVIITCVGSRDDSPEPRDWVLYQVEVRRHHQSTAIWITEHPHWIHITVYSQIVAFWFEYLTRETLAGHDDATLVPGSITFLLANSGAHSPKPARILWRSPAMRSKAGVTRGIECEHGPTALCVNRYP